MVWSTQMDHGWNGRNQSAGQKMQLIPFPLQLIPVDSPPCINPETKTNLTHVECPELHPTLGRELESLMALAFSAQSTLYIITPGRPVTSITCSTLCKVYIRLHASRRHIQSKSSPESVKWCEWFRSDHQLWKWVGDLAPKTARCSLFGPNKTGPY